jgi:hypothetical protein
MRKRRLFWQVTYIYWPVCLRVLLTSQKREISCICVRFLFYYLFTSYTFLLNYFTVIMLYINVIDMQIRKGCSIVNRYWPAVLLAFTWHDVYINGIRRVWRYQSGDHNMVRYTYNRLWRFWISIYHGAWKVYQEHKNYMLL